MLFAEQNEPDIAIGSPAVAQPWSTKPLDLMGRPDYKAGDAGPLDPTGSGVAMCQMRRLGTTLRAPRWRMLARHEEVTASPHMASLGPASINTVKPSRWFGQQSSGPLFDVERQPVRCLVYRDDALSLTGGTARRPWTFNRGRRPRETKAFQMQLARFFGPCLADLSLGDLVTSAQIGTVSDKILQLGPSRLLSSAAGHIQHSNRPASAALATFASLGLVFSLAQKNRR